MNTSTIIVRGAREHNLRNVNLELPRNQLIVFTGVSGSGKSSLAFDTLYAEGQRRYIESLSSYARQFLGQMEKPDVDFVGGLSPSISIQQKTAARNPRSTVGTITEIHDFLRVLYARIGQGHCPDCGRPITAQSREQIILRILALPEKSRCLILAPVIRGQKGEYKDLFAGMLKRGFVRARVDGQIVHLTDDLKLDRQIKHNIEIVVDRLVIEPKVRTRLAEAVEQALALGQGNLVVAFEQRQADKETGRQGDRETRRQGDKGRERDDDEGDGSLPPGLLVSLSQTKRDRQAQPEEQTDLVLSSTYACTHCGKSYEPPSPQLFSFNSPHGMCLDCDGLGVKHDFDPELMVPDPGKSFADGAVPLVGSLRSMGRWRRHIYEGVLETLDIDATLPWSKLPSQHRDWLLQGSGDRHITFAFKHRGGVWKHGGKWEGIVPQLMSSFKKVAAGPRRAQLEKYMRSIRCPTCQGQRLNAQARAVRVGGKTLIEIEAMPIGELAEWFFERQQDHGETRRQGDKRAGDKAAKETRRQGDKEKDSSPVSRSPGLTVSLSDSLTALEHQIAGELLKEIRGRLRFLLDVGLHYLTLDRSAPSLSGGEAQRIRLAGQIGCGLVGVLYILDEPSIGLHPRDNERLLRSLEQLRDLGNTVIVVEHDEETMRSADYIVDFGPGPGVRGGEVVVAGSYEQVLATPRSVTGQYLSGARKIAVPSTRRTRTKQALKIVGAVHNNLKNITVEIPLGLFVCVTGVSGSGKSSLINDILLRALEQRLGAPALREPEASGDENGADTDETLLIGKHKRILGTQHIDKIIDIDQSPIGRTPRSNPATYIKVFDEIRTLFAQLPQAKVRGYKPGRFSFNVSGGRCEACEGNGSNRLEMDFLADVWVTCPVCEGRRFNRETLQVRFKEKNIHDVLEMDVQEALVHFADVPKIRSMLQTLHDVGLDYLKLGQASPTLSGGEAQRIKLARELCRPGTRRTLYLLDEPTTGLHFDDIEKLLRVLHGFVDQGNTVLVIEHNLDVLKTADWLIDLGPEGGAGGGRVVAVGTPEEVGACAESHTGRALQVAIGCRRSAIGQKPSGRRSVPTADSPQPITQITVTGASQHNLKNINVAIPRDVMTVCTGPSGSGKTSLAMDTLYAEGQRRYVESLSSYARQFLGQVQKPKVEHVAGLSPAIAIEQKTTSRSPRSTVGTITEIHDYLRVLMARLGQQHCPRCQVPVGTQSADEIIDKVMSMPDGAKLYIMAPIERKGQEKYEALWEEMRRSGFVRMRVNGQSHSVDEPPPIDHRRKHDVEVIVDRIVVRANQRSRIADAVEAALDLGKGVLRIAHVDDKVPEQRWKVEGFSQHLSCDRCGRSFEPLNPHHFSFNSPLGWCPTCEGLGVQQGANPAALIRDPKMSLRQGALAAWPSLENETFLQFAEAVAGHLGCSLDTPFEKLQPHQQQGLLHGTGDEWLDLQGNSGRPGAVRQFQYKGLYPAIDEATRVSHIFRQRLDYLVSEVPCSACGGSRLRDDAAATCFMGKTLGELGDMPLGEGQQFFANLKLSKSQQKVAGELLREVRNRMQFLLDVGLEYLTLNRPGPTLSGGEAQRIRLASQVGSGLTGVLYVLDEPTIGLHPRDNRRLIQALARLRELGNTLVLVEHDREVIDAADHVLDFGPGAGDQGGEIVAQGAVKDVRQTKGSLTGQYLAGTRAIPVPTNRRVAAEHQRAKRSDSVRGRQGDKRRGRQGDKEKKPSLGSPAPTIAASFPARLVVKGARHNNLKNIDVEFPLGCLVAVSGVSGSGKSSLVNDVLYNTLARRLHRARTPVSAHDEIIGLELIDKVINVDQDPIGNSPSSNPATYTGVFDLIRQLFAQLPEAKIRGYQPRRFSFNKPGGRCEACEGNGQKMIEMHFLPDVWVTCDECGGTRYNPETLQVRYRGHSIADVLTMRVSHALQVFENIPKIRRVLQTLADVGLDYVSLGQSAPTLSGGEAQRVKLAAELSRPNTGRTLYILDEPTTGLHFDDIRKLLDVLHRLVDLGNTVIVIEHNLDVLKTADWVIDLGPEAGDAGGRVVAAGTPEHICEAQHTPGSSVVSHTARLLAAVLHAGPHLERPRFDPRQADGDRPDDLELEQVGKDAQMPWQVDGRRWHTVDRVDRKGTPGRWEGQALDWVVERIHALGKFGETNWNDRRIVEIAALVKSHGWFLHASTGEEWLLWLTFRVGRNAFKEAELRTKLGIKPLDETPGLQAYGSTPRVRARNERGPWQAVEIGVHWLREIDTPSFQAFLKQAVASFEQNLRRMQTKPEDLMPWKIHGEKWHHSEKGFPPGKACAWDRTLLPRLIALAREVAPDLEVNWNTRDAISLRPPDAPLAWARWRTKWAHGLDCDFFGKKAHINLARLEGLAAEHELQTERADMDRLRIVFVQPEHLQLTHLKAILKEHYAGYRELIARQ